MLLVMINRLDDFFMFGGLFRKSQVTRKILNFDLFYILIR